jgi:hypothetical protein
MTAVTTASSDARIPASSCVSSIKVQVVTPSATQGTSG